MRSISKMNNNKVISLIGGMLITGLLLVIIAFLYFLLTFNLAGGETLQEIENQRIALLVLSIIVMGLSLSISKHYVKVQKKYTAIGISILPLFVFIMVAVYYINNFNYNTPLEQTTWKQEKLKPFNMAATLVKENKLIGMTKKQIKKLLGEGIDEGIGNINHNRGFISYAIEKEWILNIYFENDKVIKVELRRPRMMT